MNNNSTQLSNGHGSQISKPNKKSKTKKQGIKVVYISNPMKVRTSASEFRALVQELTGQDSELPDPARFLEHSSAEDSNSTAQIGGEHHHHHHHHLLHHHDALDLVVPDAASPPAQEQPAESSSSNVNTQYHDDELYDELFVPEMMDSFGGFLPSSVLYGSS
ncbi:sigma factor binding protein 2, chloroplastic [Prunus avium]|uniref:Sigma factor binding protein 2, chloroplastic n=1 Tax=Prunus avium TaxID=42229 RepID=A0A6P5RRK0_PRUAV|nr:sigma factor binding protein 2, chloroplastic [Prunus avium]